MELAGGKFKTHQSCSRKEYKDCYGAGPSLGNYVILQAFRVKDDCSLSHKISGLLKKSSKPD